MTMRIEVNTSGGELLHFTFDCCTVRQLKTEIAEQLQLPLECVRLIMGTQLLEDGMVLQAEGSISVTLVVSGLSGAGSRIEELCMVLERELEHCEVYTDALLDVSVMKSIQAVRQAIPQLVKLCQYCKKSDSNAQAVDLAIGAIIPWIGACNGITTAIALKALGQIAKSGDRRAIDAVVQELRPGSWSEDVAAEVLIQIVNKGDAYAIAALENLHSTVFVLEALSHIREEGAEPALTALLARLGDPDDKIRISSVTALSQFEGTGEALARLAEPGNQRVINALTTCLEAMACHFPRPEPFQDLWTRTVESLLTGVVKVADSAGLLNILFKAELKGLPTWVQGELCRAVCLAVQEGDGDRDNAEAAPCEDDEPCTFQRATRVLIEAASDNSVDFVAAQFDNCYYAAWIGGSLVSATGLESAIAAVNSRLEDNDMRVKHAAPIILRWLKGSSAD